MRTHVGLQEAVYSEKFESPSHGTDPNSWKVPDLPDEVTELFFSEDATEDFRDLFLGAPGETGPQRRSREAVAREVFREILEAARHGEVEWVNAVYATQLAYLAHLATPRSRPPRLRTRRTRLRKAA